MIAGIALAVHTTRHELGARAADRWANDDAGSDAGSGAASDAPPPLVVGISTSSADEQPVVPPQPENWSLRPVVVPVKGLLMLVRLPLTTGHFAPRMAAAMAVAGRCLHAPSRRPYAWYCAGNVFWITALQALKKPGKNCAHSNEHAMGTAP